MEARLGMRRRRLITCTMLTGLSLAFLHACGKTGTSTEQGFGPQKNLSGSLTTQFGSQREMAGWVVVLLEKETGISRVAEADGAGIYSFAKASSSRAHSIVLLSPNFVVSSVLALPPAVQGTIRQWFSPSGIYLPRLIHRGDIVQFDTLDGIKILSDAATDSDGDMIPDGSSEIKLHAANDTSPLSLLQQTSSYDTDLDGLLNHKDPDIDGDGMANAFDNDDDADGTLDYFDFDANGDVIADSLQEIGDQYFTEGVHFATVQYETVPNDDGSTTDTLTFVTRLRDGVTPTAVQVRGDTSVLSDAVVEAEDSDGNTVETNFDGLLLDDGLSSDAAEGDLIFGRRIKLAEGTRPRANQVFFIQLAFSSGAKAWFMEFPVTFPKVTTHDIEAAYDATTKSIAISGNPFGDDVSDYLWTVVAYDEDERQIYKPTAQFGSETSHELDIAKFESGKTYKFAVIAQVIDRIPGYSQYLIHSPKIEVTIE